MSASLTQEKQQVHEMVERLAPNQLTAVRGLLEVLLDPLARSLANAPIEDEEITAEMAAALDRVRASIERGEGVRHEDVLREFGLNPRS